MEFEMIPTSLAVIVWLLFMVIWWYSGYTEVFGWIMSGIMSIILLVGGVFYFNYVAES